MTTNRARSLHLKPLFTQCRVEYCRQFEIDTTTQLLSVVFIARHFKYKKKTETLFTFWDFTRCMHKVFVVNEKQIIFKGISCFVYSKDWPSASTRYDHLSGKLWIPRLKKCFYFAEKHSLSHFQTSSKLLKCCYASASYWCEELLVRCRQVKGLRRGRKDVPSKWFQGVFHQFWCVRRGIVL